MRKSKLVLALLAGAVMTGAVCGITACNNDKDPEPPESDVVLNFVAVTKTGWDADTTFTSVVNEKDYNLTYKLSLDLNKDKTLKLTGTCQSGKEKTSGGQGGGPGGPGDSGGPGGAPAMLAEEQAPSESTEETPAITDWTPYDFTLSGTWSEQTGWGYTVKIDGTEIKVDYDLTQGRHTFYYYAAPTINNKKADEVLVQMQAKDSDYRKTLASDYQTYHVKESAYVMYGFNDNGGNFTRVNIYLMPDGSVASYSESGSSLTYNGKGSWREDKTANTLAITVGTSTYNSNAYDEAVGYRINYSSSITGFVSTVANKTSKELTDKDFEGETLFTLSGKDANTQADYTLDITQKGWAILKDSAGSRVAVCTYEKQNGNYVIAYGQDTYTSAETADGISVTMAFSVTTTNSSGQASTTNYNITLTGTVPAAN